jgi:hypothetical protein
MGPARLRATVSLDLDDHWTYLKTRGDARWAAYPTYLPIVVPRVLDLLDELRLRITFFVVGRDAAVPAHAPLMRALADRGHEIGNHSFEHDCWLHRYRVDRLTADLAQAEEAIERATGRKPIGFRGPGFSWSSELLEILSARGYRYDASSLPTIVGPLARMYFLWTARLTPEQRKERHALFGSLEDALRPLKPYRWELGNGGLVEIPVTTMPVARIPFHLSYLLYLRTFSWYLMAAYLDTALALCRLFRVEPSFLLHPLDVLGPDEAPGLEFFPGMALRVDRKTEVFRYALARMQQHFEVVTLESFSAELATNSQLAGYRPGRSIESGEDTESARRASPDSYPHALRLRQPESFSPVDTEV